MTKEHRDHITGPDITAKSTINGDFWRKATVVVSALMVALTIISYLAGMAKGQGETAATLSMIQKSVDEHHTIDNARDEVNGNRITALETSFKSMNDKLDDIKRMQIQILNSHK